MNKFTLAFLDLDFEKKFKLSQHKQEYKILETNFKYILLLAIITIINNATRGQYLFAFLISLTFLGTIFLRYKARNSPMFLDYASFFTLIIFNLSVPISIYIGSATNEKNSMFYLGQSNCYAFFAFLLGTQFILKAIVCLINCFVQISLLWASDQDYQSLGRYFFIIFSFMLVNGLYIAEKEKRLRFQLQCQKNQCDQLLFQYINVSVIQCNFNQSNNALFFKKSNEKAKQSFGITDEESFKQFIRLMNITKYLNQNDQNDFKQRQQLEKCLYDLFNKTFSIILLSSLKTLYDLQFQLIGEFEKQEYFIKICFFYIDEPYCFIIIENNLQKEMQQIKYQAEFFKKLSDNLLENQLKYLNNIQIIQEVFKKKNEVQQRKQNQLIMQKNYQLIQFWIYISLNQLKNQQIYQHGAQIYYKMETFTIQSLIEELKLIFYPYLQYKKIQIRLSFQQNYLMTTYKQLFLQLLTNLLFNSIQHSKQKQLIKIDIKQKQLNCLHKRILQFQIIDNNDLINENLIKTLPILNPTTIEGFYKCFHQQKLRLGLVISSYILRIIGPDQKINICSNLKQLKVQFEVFQNLSLNNFVLRGELQPSKQINLIKESILQNL